MLDGFFQGDNLLIVFLTSIVGILYSFRLILAAKKRESFGYHTNHAVEILIVCSILSIVCISCFIKSLI